MPFTALFAALVLVAPQAKDDFPKLWSSITGSINGMYYAKETRKDELVRVLAKYKPQAEAAPDRSAFARTVNAMIAELGDSHFALFGNDQQGYYIMDAISNGDKAKPMPNIGAWYKHGSDGYTVQMVINGSSAEKAGLRNGDKVETVDGAKFRPVASFAKEGNVKLGINRGGKSMTLAVETSQTTAREMFLDGTKASVKVIENGGKRIGYIHLWTMVGDDFRNAVSSAVYGELVNTDACILDLRDGFGGRPEGFADPFFRPDVKLEWKGPLMAYTQQFGYQRPLVVLINGGSRSAKEVLSEILKVSKRATLVGSTTAGHVLGTFPLKVSDWAYLEIPMVDVVTGGVRLEGRGVSPDVAVAEEFDATGKDLYIEKAVELLSTK